MVHNAGLCLASLAMFLGGAYELYRASGYYTENTVSALLCDAEEHIRNDTNFYFWSYLYYLSKFWEACRDLLRNDSC